MESEFNDNERSHSIVPFPHPLWVVCVWYTILGLRGRGWECGCFNFDIRGCKCGYSILHPRGCVYSTRIVLINIC